MRRSYYVELQQSQLAVRCYQWFTRPFLPPVPSQFSHIHFSCIITVIMCEEQDARHWLSAWQATTRNTSPVEIHLSHSVCARCRDQLTSIFSCCDFDFWLFCSATLLLLLLLSTFFSHSLHLLRINVCVQFRYMCSMGIFFLSQCALPIYFSLILFSPTFGADFGRLVFESASRLMLQISYR